MDISSCSSGSDLQSPSPKIHGKSKKKFLYQGQLQKRKHSSSNSLPTSDSDSHGSYKRVRRTKKRRVEKADFQQKNCLLDVFQKHYESLVTMIKSSPLTICTKLFSNRFISEDIWNQVITGQDSHLKKASLLLCDVHSHLKVHPDGLIEFVELLEQDASFNLLVCQMKGKKKKVSL